MSALRDKLTEQLTSLQTSITEIENQILDEDNGDRFFAGDKLRHMGTGNTFLLALVDKNTFCFIAESDGKYRKKQFFVDNGEEDGILLSKIVSASKASQYEKV